MRLSAHTSAVYTCVSVLSNKEWNKRRGCVGSLCPCKGGQTVGLTNSFSFKATQG